MVILITSTTPQYVQPSMAVLSMGVSGQKEIRMTFSLETAYQFELGDTVVWESETYYLNALPQTQKKSSLEIVYSAVFEATYYDLTKVQFMYEGMNEFYFNGTLRDILNILMDNVYRIYGAGHLELAEAADTEYRNMFFRHQSCMQILNAVVQEWEMEYYFSGTTLYVQETVGTDSGETFQYGMGLGLYSITREKIESKNIITRLWAVGSDRNIPWNYRPGSFDTRNLLKRSGAVDLVDAVDINGYCTKTYLGENRWQFVCSGGTSDIRLSVDHTLLTDSATYYASTYYTCTASWTLEWCDTGGTGQSASSTPARASDSGSRVYDDTYDYMSLQIPSGATLVVFDAQIEGTGESSYEGGYALTSGRFVRRLMFNAPGSHYLESNVATYGLVEYSKVFEDIYPHRTGRVTTIGTELEFLDSTMDFDVNTYLIGGVTASVIFNTGDCAGYEFSIETYEHTGNTLGDRCFTIIQNQDQQGYTIPTSGGIRPAVGDEYVILNITMPASYVSAAESELQTAAQNYLNQNDSPRVAYRVEVDPEYAVAQSLSFTIGDSITVVDADIDVNRLIRITNIEYNLLQEGDMKITLSDDLEPNLITRLYAEEERVNTILAINGPLSAAQVRNGYRSAIELQELIFDNTGYFDPTNINALSIETAMLTVGSKWTAFQLECTIDGNPGGVTTGMNASAGRLLHFALDPDYNILTWTLQSHNQTSLTSGTAYYLYARCHYTNYTASTNRIEADAAQRDLEDGTHYNFMVGVLHAEANGFRDVSLTYGMTQINGGFINTGRISAIGGSNYFDLNSGDIVGKITFSSGSSGYTNISDIPTSLDDINSTEYSKYESHNSVFQQTGTPTANAVGDIWVDTDDNNRVRYWTGSAWIDASVIDAIEAYFTAAMGKTVYYQAAQPGSGTEGDVWIDTDDSYKGYVYYNGTWTETTNAEALAAAALADGKVQTFYQASAPTTGMQQGDFWVDTDDNYQQYVYTGGTWVDLTVADAVQALQDAADAQSTADGKIVSFWQTSAPTAEGTGDIWFDTDDGNRAYRWSGSQWVDAQDDDIASAISQAQTAQTTADGKAEVFYQIAAPTGVDSGDMWVDIDDGNKVYVYRLPTWHVYPGTVFAQTTAPTTNMADGDLWRDTDGGNAIDLYTGGWTTYGNTTYVQGTTPTGMSTGDYWINTVAGNEVQYYNGSIWTTVPAGVAVFIQGTAPTTGVADDMWFDTSNNFADYKYTGSWANYPYTRWVQASQPTGTETGQLWFDSDDSYACYIFKDEAWELVSVDDAIAALSDIEDIAAWQDGKVTTFVQSYTTDGYPTAEGIGDLWLNTDTGSLHRWDGGSWNLDVADVTQTVIDGGLITTGRIEVQNSTTSQGGMTGTTAAGSTAVGLWLGATYANRANAPFKVLHNGSVTVSSASGTGQRVVIQSSDNTLRFFDSTNTERIRLDDGIYGANAGMKVYGDTNDQTSILAGQIRITSADEDQTNCLYINQAYSGTGTIFGADIWNQSAFSATTGTVVGIRSTVEAHSTATAAYGVWIDMSTGPSTATWALYADGGRSYFSGDISIGATTAVTSGYRVELFSTDNKGRAADWTGTSDIRLKTNIKKHGPVLCSIMALHDSKYGLSVYNRRKMDKDNKPTDEYYNEWEVGFIAQDTTKPMPLLVHGSEKEFYDISYMRMAAVAVTGVAEVKIEKDKEIADLKKRLEKLENRGLLNKIRKLWQR
jgi:hypothetical protein